jgi:hypothetical protein
MATEQAVEFTLVLSNEERAALLRLLEQSLVETHAEKRRTEAPGYQAQVHHEESLIRTLVEKVRRLGP